jgi:hypothetical protein
MYVDIFQITWIFVADIRMANIMFVAIFCEWDETFPFHNFTNWQNKDGARQWKTKVINNLNYDLVQFSIMLPTKNQNIPHQQIRVTFVTRIKILI